MIDFIMFGFDSAMALFNAANGLDDAYRFWLMDHTPYVDVMQALGFIVYEDGSMVLP